MELWLSDDNQNWEFAQTLKRSPVPPGAPQDVTRYPLEKPMTRKYFKLVFKKPSPVPVAEVDLTESASVSPPPERNPDSGKAEEAGIVRPHISKTTNRVEMDITAKTDAYLLRLENYHKGWTATLDGNEVPILRVYPNFQMVSVPAGNHTLTFEFHSLYHHLANLFVVTGFLGGFAFLLWLGQWKWGRQTNLGAYENQPAKTGSIEV